MIADDAELLRRYAEARDDAAFAELVDRYLGLVYSVALRRMSGDAHRAEDVAQTVFALLARKASSLIHHESLAGWLHTTARFTASETMRTERRRLAREKEAQTMHELSTDSAAGDQWGRLRPILDEVLCELNEQDRQVVLLRFFANLSFAELGSRIHLAENTARMRADRALEKLRGLLEKRGLTSTTSAIGLMLANQAAVAAPVGLAATVTAAALSGPVVAGASATALKTLTLMSSSKITISALAVVLIAAGFYWGTQASAYEKEALRISSPVISETPAADKSPGEKSTQKRAGVAEEKKWRFDPLVSEQIWRSAMVNALPNSPESRVYSERIRVRLRFHSLYSVLGLSPEQIERFETAAAKRPEMMLYGDHMEVDPDAGRTGLIAFAARALNATVAETLGEAYVAPFRDFFATSELRLVADDLAANTWYTSAPLNKTQADRLVQLCLECSAPNPALARLNPNAVDWDAVSDRAATFLAPAQMEALRSMIALRRFDQEFQKETGLPFRRPVRGL